MAKKIVVLFFGFLLSSCAAFQQNEEEFKNPLFNQLLNPLSTGAGYTYIYPTLIEYRGLVDTDRIIAVGRCKMIENKTDHVTLKCRVKYIYDPEFRKPEYHTFIIKEKLHRNCIRVEEQIRDLDVGYSLDAPLSSGSLYCVRPD